MKYAQRWNDVPFEVNSHQVTRWACCDCGLTHDIAFVARGDVIEVATRVNHRATAAKRRKPQKAVLGPPAAAREHSSPRQVEREGSRDEQEALGWKSDAAEFFLKLKSAEAEINRLQAREGELVGALEKCIEAWDRHYQEMNESAEDDEFGALYQACLSGFHP